MKRRQAFTLVELMVSMALIIFIMAILSQAFIAALTTFRNLKGQGDLAEKLRSTMQILQRDLGADHFESNRRLSDPTFWNNGPPQQGFFQVYQGPAANPAGTWFGTSPVTPGFAQVYVGDPILGSTSEGVDPSLIHSYRSINHALAFTVKLVGNDMGDFMSASALGSGNVWNPITLTPVVPQLPGNPGPPGGLGIGAITLFGPQESRYQPIVSTPSVTGYNYQWAEVAWFLQPQINPSTLQQDQTAPDPETGSQPVPLYTLYRRQRLLVPDNNLVTLSTIPQGSLGVPSSLIANFLEMSCWANGNTIYFNSPVDITVPNRRLGGGNPLAFTTIAQDVANPNIGAGNLTLANLAGSDIQMSDVVSFDVRVLPLYPIVPGSVPPKIRPDATPQLNPPAEPFVSLYDRPFNSLFKTANSGAFFDTWSSVSDGLVNYSAWATTIPFWTTTPLTYQYPFGNALGQTIQTPATGSGPIIQAIQVTIRIWDFKTNQTRQVTIVQAM